MGLEQDGRTGEHGARFIAAILAMISVGHMALLPGWAGQTLGNTVLPASPATAIAILAALGWLGPGRARSMVSLAAACVLALAAYELAQIDVPRRRALALLTAGPGAAWLVTRAARLLPGGHGARQAALMLAISGAALLARPLLTTPSGLIRSGPGGASPARWDNRLAMVLITMDTTRRDALGCYGAGPEATPQLDAFARTATRYARASSTSPFTAPSMASLVTAQSPLDHGCVSGSPQLNPATTTLAEHCDDLGLATAGFLDNPWLGDDFGLARGYRTLWSETDLEAIQAWLDRNAHRPFLLHVHLFTPHGPYELREEHATALRIDTRSEAAGAIGPLIGARTIQGGEIPGRHGFSPSEIRWLEDVYRTEVRAMDAWIGALLRALEARGLRERSVIAITSDHGEEFGERGGLHHSHTLFGELVDVPLLLAVPGRKARVETKPISLRAIPELLLAASGWPVPTALQAPDDPLVTSVRLRQGGRHLARVADRSATLHLRLTPGQDAPLELALHSTSEDPAEMRDVAEDQPEVLRTLLEETSTRRLIERLRAIPCAPEESATASLSAPTRRKLRALGYAR